LISIENDSSIDLGNFSTPLNINSTVVYSSSVESIWYDSDISRWSAFRNEAFDTLESYKGFDISEPILLTNNKDWHCTKSVIKVGYSNNIYIAYECTIDGIPRVEIIGTDAPSSSLPLGILEGRQVDSDMHYFFKSSDFSEIASFSQGLNQLPDMFVDLNEVLHVTWQSNRDNVWEIYYASSDNSFAETRITNYDSRSLSPTIHGDEHGRMYIAWHDNRFGGYEILMAYKAIERILPLYEQDPYMASLRNNYSHYTGIININLTNNDTVVRCFSDIHVDFYTDRLLENKELTVSQSEWPFAFKSSKCT